MIHDRSGRRKVADDWSETWENAGWTGHTLFLQRKGELPDRLEPQCQNSAPAATTQIDDAEVDECDDGSF